MPWSPPRLRSTSIGCIQLSRRETSTGKRSFAFKEPFPCDNMASALHECDNSLVLNRFPAESKNSFVWIASVTNIMRHYCGVLVILVRSVKVRTNLHGSWSAVDHTHKELVAKTICVSLRGTGLGLSGIDLAETMYNVVSRNTAVSLKSLKHKIKEHSKMQNNKQRCPRPVTTWYVAVRPVAEGLMLRRQQ